MADICQFYFVCFDYLIDFDYLIWLLVTQPISTTLYFNVYTIEFIVNQVL